MWQDVYEGFSSELSKSEQIALFNAIKGDLFPVEPEKWVKYLELMIEDYTLPKIAKRLKILYRILLET